MKTRPSTPIVGSSLLIIGIVLLSVALLLTIILIEPSSTQKQIPSEEAADFVGYVGTVCGHVTGVRQDSKDGIALLFFGAPDSPSFEAVISIRNRNAERNYEGKEVCVAGRVVNEFGGPQGMPSIRVTDASQVTIE